MAAKRKYRKGLGTAILCILRNEGAASTSYLARRLGYSFATIDNVLLSLDARKLISYGSFMYPGKSAIYPKGSGLVYKVCPREGMMPLGFRGGGR